MREYGIFVRLYWRALVWVLGPLLDGRRGEAGGVVCQGW